jgi:lipoprotein signal peptidase
VTESTVSVAAPPARRRTDREPNQGWRHVLLIALLIAVVDWVTKAVVSARIPLDGMVVVVDDRVALWHVRNPALILGLFGDLEIGVRKVIAVLLAIATLTLLLQIISRAHRLLPRRRPWAWLFSGLLLGGMLGNLGERSLHWWVTDFLSFRWGPYWLPPGNIADLAIVTSLPIAFLVILFELEARAMRGRSSSGAPTRLVPDDMAPG